MLKSPVQESKEFSRQECQLISRHSLWVPTGHKTTLYDDPLLNIMLNIAPGMCSTYIMWYFYDNFFFQGIIAILSLYQSFPLVHQEYCLASVVYVMVVGNQLFKLKMHNLVLSYCSTVVVQGALLSAVVLCRISKFCCIQDVYQLALQAAVHTTLLATAWLECN